MLFGVGGWNVGTGSHIRSMVKYFKYLAGVDWMHNTLIMSLTLQRDKNKFLFIQNNSVMHKKANFMYKISENNKLYFLNQNLNATATLFVFKFDLNPNDLFASINI